MTHSAHISHTLIDSVGPIALYHRDRAFLVKDRYFLVTVDGQERLRGAESTVRSFYAGAVAMLEREKAGQWDEDRLALAALNFAGRVKNEEETITAGGSSLGWAPSDEWRDLMEAARGAKPSGSAGGKVCGSEAQRWRDLATRLWHCAQGGENSKATGENCAFCGTPDDHNEWHPDGSVCHVATAALGPRGGFALEADPALWPDPAVPRTGC